MSTNADIGIKLSAEGVEQVVAGFRRVASEAQRSAKDAGGAYGSLGSVLNTLRGSLGALGVAFSAVGLVNFVKQGLDAAGQINDLAKNIGMSTTDVQALSFAFRQAGADSDLLGTVAARLSVKIEELRSGSDDATKAFRRIGLGVKDFGTDSAVNLTTVARAFGRFADDGRKTALQMDLLGRAGWKVNSAFGEIVGGMERVRKEAGDAGALNSPETIEKVDELGDKVQRVADGFKAVRTNLIAAGYDLAKWFANLPGQGKGSLDITTPWGFAMWVTDRYATAGHATAPPGPVLGPSLPYLGPPLPERKSLPPPEDDSAKAAAKEREAQAKRTADAITAATRDAANAQLQIEKDSADLSVAIAKGEYDARMLTIEDYYAKLRAAADAEFDAEVARVQAVKGPLGSLLDIQDIEIRRKIRLTELTNEQADAERRQADEARKIAEEQERKAEEKRRREYAETAAGRLEEVMANLKSSIMDVAESGLTDFFADVATGARSLTDVLRGVLNELTRMAARILALRALGLFLGGGAGGGAAVVGIDEGPLNLAGGGLVRGPGTGTSDSVGPAWLSRGEYVVPARAVSQPGVLPMLESLRVDRLSLAHPKGGLKFAEGGFVGPAPAPVKVGLSGRMEVGLAEGLVAQHIEMPDSVRALIKVVGANRGMFNSALGR